MSHEKEGSVLELAGGEPLGHYGTARAAPTLEGAHSLRRVSLPAPLYDTVEAAAAKLGLDAEALRARCRRAAKPVGASIEAHLGGGIVAFKFGRSWRVRFPHV
jgi:hypothetical protein